MCITLTLPLFCTHVHKDPPPKRLQGWHAVSEEECRDTGHVTPSLYEHAASYYDLTECKKALEACL